MNETYFVYILKSKKDGSYYVGQTNDLDVRVNQHNEGLSKYTSGKIPLKLVYFEMFSNRADAIKRELEIKRKKSRKYLEFLIDNWRNEYS